MGGQGKRTSMENRFKQWTLKEDGSHYLQIWNFFQSRAPRPIDILARNVLDVLKAGEISEYGHVAVAKYTNMGERMQLIRSPTLANLGHGTSWRSSGEIHEMSERKDKLRRLIQNCREVEESMVVRSTYRSKCQLDSPRLSSNLWPRIRTDAQWPIVVGQTYTSTFSSATEIVRYAQASARRQT